jgi:predicted amidohydrolase YtcJ
VDGLITRRRLLGGATLAVAGATLGACLPDVARPTPSRSAARRATLVMHAGHILTMDASRPEADAIAIAGDTIVAVGSDAEVGAVAAPGAQVIDLAGRTVLPGFNDAHCHRIGDRDLSGHDSIEAAIDDALAGGWTSISELFVDQDRLDELRALDEASGLRIRVNCYFPINYENQRFWVWFGDYRPHQEFSSKLRVGGVKLFADSAWTDKAYMTQPHLDQPGYRGEPYWTPDELTWVVRSLHADGWQMAIHTCGDAAHDMVLDAYEAALAGADNADHRHRIEHVMYVRDDQVRRMAELSIVASFQLTWFLATDEPQVAASLGQERTRWAGRWRDLLDAGVPAVLSTDHPYEEVDGTDSSIGWAMRALAVAANRTAGDPASAPSWRADQAITVDAGLDLLTRAGAYATFEEDRKGTITPGKLADLVVLDADPRHAAPDRLADVNVLMTMVGGTIEYRSPDAGGAAREPRGARPLSIKGARLARRQ